MMMCDWCGESLPERETKAINLRPQNWPFSDCKNKYVQIQLHDECCGALVGLLREDDLTRPAPLETKQRAFRVLKIGGSR